MHIVTLAKYITDDFTSLRIVCRVCKGVSVTMENHSDITAHGLHARNLKGREIVSIEINTKF